MFWIGEYAVLFGGPAVVAAVNRYAFAYAEASKETSELKLSSSMSKNEVCVDASRGIEDSRPEWALLRAVFETLRAAFSDWTPPSGSIHFDSSHLSAEEKLGLGSSGAVAVLAVKLLGGGHIQNREQLQTLAFDAHRRFQGGIGSGGDIIASTWGGLQMIRGDKRRAVGVPENLHVGALYSGTDALTGDLVRKVKQARLEDSQVEAILREMGECAANGVRALDEERIERWLTCIERFHGLERELTRASGAPIVSDAVQACVDLAKEAGCVAKASGAGGGDVIVAFSNNESGLQRLRERASEHPRITFIPLEIDRNGICPCGEPPTIRSADY
jgi:phosphomevalonate kinase